MARVTAPLVTARTTTGRVVYLYKGDVVPEGITAESLSHLRDLGFIDGGDTAEPPRSGRGSGRDEWADFASDAGLDVTDDMSRDDIIDALVAEGVVSAE